MNQRYPGTGPEHFPFDVGERVFAEVDRLAGVGTERDGGPVERDPNATYPAYPISEGQIPGEIAQHFIPATAPCVLSAPRYELTMGYTQDAPETPDEPGEGWVAWISLTKIVSQSNGVEHRSAVDYMTNFDAGFGRYRLDRTVGLEKVLPESIEAAARAFSRLVADGGAAALEQCEQFLRERGISEDEDFWEALNKIMSADIARESEPGGTIAPSGLMSSIAAARMDEELGGIDFAEANAVLEFLRAVAA